MTISCNMMNDISYMNNSTWDFPKMPPSHQIKFTEEEPSYQIGSMFHSTMELKPQLVECFLLICVVGSK